MRYRKLGRSELEVSVLTMGCWAIAGDSTWGPQDEGDAIQALRTAYELGINHFDTASGYGQGRSEELVGRALKDVRDEVIVATKVWPDMLRPDDIRTSCETSLKWLDMDYVDLLYIHWPNWDVPLADTVGAMEKLVEEGKARYIECSNFGKQDLTELLQHVRVDVDQLPYNLLWRSLEFEILPTCIENDVSVACYSPLLHGLLTGKFQSVDEIPWGRTRTRHFSGSREGSRHGESGAEEETFEALGKIRQICDQAGLPMAQVAMAWLLHQEGVATVVAGARSPEQVRSNVAMASLELPSDMIAALNEATDPLKEKLGPNPDMWQTESGSRMR